MSFLPVHPAPVRGEALSSWLRRLAWANSTTTEAILAHLSEDINARNIDFDQRPALLDKLARATRVPLSMIEVLTIHGSKIPGSAGRQTVLLAPAIQIADQPPSLVPWQVPLALSRLCVDCEVSAEPPIIPLAWRLPLVSTCTVHGRLLKTRGLRDYSLSADVISTDLRTTKALQGEPILSHSAITAVDWLGGLHRLLRELSSPVVLMHLPPRTRAHLMLTPSDGVATGNRFTQPAFEQSTVPKQMRFLRAASIILRDIETGALRVDGDHPLVQAIKPRHAVVPTVHLTFGRAAVRGRQQGR